MDRNLAAWLLASGEPERPAIVTARSTLTYAELARRARAVAAIVPGDAIVPIVGACSPELAAAQLGVLHAGAVAAPIPPLPDGALARVLARTRARLVLASAAELARVKRAAPGVEVVDLAAPLPERDAPAVARAA